MAPAFLAMFNKFLLLSKPIVQISPGRPGDKGRYFPFPVPESNPTHPVVKLERKFAMIGHGYPNEIEGNNRENISWSSCSPCIVLMKNGGRFRRRLYVHSDTRIRLALPPLWLPPERVVPCSPLISNDQSVSTRDFLMAERINSHHMVTRPVIMDRCTTTIFNPLCYSTISRL